jgi:spermidine synthase
VQFPLLIALLGEGEADVGRQVGQAYAWNTAGAILGSLAGGFGLLPLLGAPGAWKLVVALLAALGLWATAVALRGAGARRQAIGPLALALVALALLSARGPTAAWRHGAIGAGRGPSAGTPNTLEAWSRALRRAVSWEAEGVESSVALDGEAGLAFVVNGKIDGNARSDAPTQVMSGLIGALLHPQVKRAMVIGLGTGSTAGWLGALPSAERVDVAELEPAIRHVAEACKPVNQAVLENPKVHLFLGDARELLGTTRQRYDLIFSEPSNPYRAGISSLFTQEFYRAAKERLDQGGVFLQWVQAYSVDAQTVRSVYATLASVFPEVETWVTEEADLVLVASERPLDHDPQRLRARMAEEPWRSALATVWRVSDLEGLFAHYAARGSLARAIAAAEPDAINTDDLTLVEFGFARGVGRRDTLFRTNDLRELARARHIDRPADLAERSDGAIDWARVDARRLSMLAAQEAQPSGLPYRFPDAVMQRALAMGAWLNGDYAMAWGHWSAQPEPPSDLVELLVAGDVLAERADEAALAPIAQLRAAGPSFAVEGDAIEARLRLRQGRLAEATALLEGALVAYRRDPWPMPALMAHVLQLPVELAQRDRALGERLFRALEQPFAVSLLDGARQNARIELAIRVDFPRLCVEALAPFEPEAAWKRDFLTGRLDCYRRNHHPLEAAAARDLERFQSAEPTPFAAGL